MDVDEDGLLPLPCLVMLCFGWLLDVVASIGGIFEFAAVEIDFIYD